MTKKVLGRPSSFSEELALLICSRLSDGESLRAICRDADMPHFVTVLRWVGDERHETFRKQYEEARLAGLEQHADAILEIADAPVAAGDSAAVAKQRLQIDARKWVLSKLVPKKYGDKQTHTIGGDADAPPVAIEQTGVSPDVLAALTKAVLSGSGPK